MPLPHSILSAGMNGDDDFGRKRKNCLLTTLSTFNPRDGGGDEHHPDTDDDFTALSLSFPSSRQRLPSTTPLITPPVHSPLELYSLQSPPLPHSPSPGVLLDSDAISSVPVVDPVAAAPRGCGRRRMANSVAKEMARNEKITPPFPWATDRRAMIYSLNSLLSRRIDTIQGTVRCKKCEKSFDIEYDLEQKFVEVGRYIADNKASMRDRAPPAWMNPALPRCKFCNQDNSAKPVLPQDKERINWLFLLLGQMIGCCTLDQLKYFCEHTKNHRTGAKDRIVYYTYLGLCKQLAPAGPFDP